MDVSLLSKVNEARANRHAIILATRFDDGSQWLIRPGDANEHPSIEEEIRKRFRSGKSGMIVAGGDEVFLNVHVPPPRIVVIGAVHISQALAPMAKLAGFDVTIIDPRTAFASDERFPNVNLIADWPDIVLPDLQVDPYTAMVAVTHDPKIDDGPLRCALEADSFYVGALGSRKTHAKRVERLMAAGVDSSRIDRIEAPIGLDIGAASPAEIAVAVLGSIIRALRKGPEASA